MLHGQVGLFSASADISTHVENMLECAVHTCWSDIFIITTRIHKLYRQILLIIPETLIMLEYRKRESRPLCFILEWFCVASKVRRLQDALQLSSVTLPTGLITILILKLKPCHMPDTKRTQSSLYTSSLLIYQKHKQNVTTYFILKIIKSILQ